jgi:hypothetical protein
VLVIPSRPGCTAYASPVHEHSPHAVLYSYADNVERVTALLCRLRTTTVSQAFTGISMDNVFYA